MEVPTDIFAPYFYKEGKFYKNMVEEVSIQEMLSANPEVS
jgi:hypothetical protein